MIVDLSLPLEDFPSEPVRPQVAFEDHDATAPLVAGLFGCLPVKIAGASAGWCRAAAVVDGA